MTASNSEQHVDGEVKELVWILRRMFYMFIRWAEKKYGWPSSDR